MMYTSLEDRKKKELQKMLEHQIMLESLLSQHLKKENFISKVVVGLSREIADSEKRIENFYEIWGFELSNTK